MFPKETTSRRDLKYEVKVEGDSISLAGRVIQVLPCQRLGVWIAIGSSGKFGTRVISALHLAAGASKVLISARSDGAYILHARDIRHFPFAAGCLFCAALGLWHLESRSVRIAG